MFTIESAPLSGGALLHLITTSDPFFAFTLHELALNLTIEPTFHASDEVFTLEFTATPEELAAITDLASRLAAKPQPASP